MRKGRARGQERRQSTATAAPSFGRGITLIDAGVCRPYVGSGGNTFDALGEINK